MRSRRTLRHWLVASTCIVGFCAGATPAHAANGEYTVGICQADRLGSSTEAFAEDARRGMSIAVNCEPGKREPRAVLIGNMVSKNGRVPDRSYAKMVTTAPPGTVFKTFSWAGFSNRSNCEY